MNVEIQYQQHCNTIKRKVFSSSTMLELHVHVGRAGIIVELSENLIGRVSENKRAPRAARTLERFVAVLCKTKTSDYHNCGFDDNFSIEL